MRLKKTWVIAGTIGLSLLAFTVAGPGWQNARTAAADELTEKQQELDQVQALVESTRRELNERQRQEKGVLGQLNAVKQEMNQTEVTIDGINRQSKEVEAAIADLEQEIAATQNRLDERLALLKARLKDIYINGNISYLEVLFQSEHLMDFLTRWDLMQRVIEQDADLVRQIEVEQKALEARKADLELRRSELAGLRVQAEAQKQRLDQQSQEHRQLLSTVKAQKEVVKRMLDDLEATSNRLVGVIRSLQAKQNRPSMGSGPMAHPLPNYVDITSPFGPRIHPLLNTPRNHSGVDFSSPAGRPVKAAQTGVVIFAGEMGPNGNTVIVDHGDGVSTLYAHFSVIGVKENQTVQKGQVVGNVGSTGWSTGPHLHFEVRINGNPVNPLGYIGG